MSNGSQGDHPLTDIIYHKVEVYGEEEDKLISEIANLSSRRELYEWWEKEIGWSPNKTLLLTQLNTRLNELRDRANKSGWELKE